MPRCRRRFAWVCAGVNSLGRDSCSVALGGGSAANDFLMTREGRERGGRKGQAGRGASRRLLMRGRGRIAGGVRGSHRGIRRCATRCALRSLRRWSTRWRERSTCGLGAAARSGSGSEGRSQNGPTPRSGALRSRRAGRLCADPQSRRKKTSCRAPSASLPANGPTCPWKR